MVVAEEEKQYPALTSSPEAERFKVWHQESPRYSWIESQIFSIQYTFDSYPTRFNLVRFLTLTLISSNCDLFSIQNMLLEERSSCSLMTWCNSNMSILLGMATSDCENNARLVFHIPSNHYEQLDWQLYTCNKREQLRISSIEFDFEVEQLNRFTTVWLYKLIIAKIRCYQP